MPDTLSIAASSTSPATSHWQQELQVAVRDPAELLDMLALPAKWLPAAQQATKTFPLRVPRGFVSRMQHGNIDDPLLRQVLPLGEELVATDGYSNDPVGDLASQVVPGVLHKYHGRALLVMTGACGVHCRYCFRREYPYSEASLNRNQREAALTYLRQDKSITEVLLSGGDPLSLTDTKLAEWFAELNAIEHIQRIRIHSRQPIVLPSRVTTTLLGIIQGSRAAVVMVVHSNHAHELDEKTQHAMHQLKAASAALLNQSVLLAGVNDSAETLIALSDALFAAGVLPYYLHQLDRVQGAAHFAVSDANALALHAAMRNRLPGYLMPRLVKEVAGETTKMPLAALIK